MQQVYFVTATDTEAGKTFCTAALLRAAEAGRRSIGSKPVASGADGAGVNADAAALQAASCNRPASCGCRRKHSHRNGGVVPCIGRNQKAR